MGAIVFGILALIVVLFLLGGFSKVNPHTMAIALKATGGGGALVIATLLALRGRIDIAVPLGIFGLGLLGWLRMNWLAPPFDNPKIRQAVLLSVQQKVVANFAFRKGELTDAAVEQIVKSVPRIVAK